MIDQYARAVYLLTSKYRNYPTYFLYKQEERFMSLLKIIFPWLKHLIIC